MESSNMNFTVLLNHFIANSILTKKQTSIIYNKMLKAKAMNNMTSGAYYRQIRQCRDKTQRVVYTLLLLRLLNAVDIQAFSVLDQVNNQLNVISNKQNDVIDATSLNDVISLIDNVIRKLVLI
jgi:hypothetical protein